MSMTWTGPAPAQKYRCIDTGGCVGDRFAGPWSGTDAIECRNFDICGDLVCPVCGGDVEKTG